MLSQNAKQQLDAILQQQKLQLDKQILIQEAKPKFTALQNIERLFKDKPVVTHEKHRIRLEDIA
jgi:hypothetical protein